MEINSTVKITHLCQKVIYIYIYIYLHLFIPLQKSFIKYRRDRLFLSPIPFLSRMSRCFWQPISARKNRSKFASTWETWRHRHRLNFGLRFYCSLWSSPVHVALDFQCYRYATLQTVFDDTIVIPILLQFKLVLSLSCLSLTTIEE